MADTTFTIGINGEDNLSPAADSASKALANLNSSSAEVAEGLSASTEALNRISTESQSVASAAASTTAAFADLGSVAGELGSRFASAGEAFTSMTAQLGATGEALSALTARFEAASEGAQAAGAGINHAAEEAESASEHVSGLGGMFEKLGESITDVGKMAAGFVIGSAIINVGFDIADSFKKGIESANELGEAVHQLMLTTGGSAEELSGLIAGAERLGVSYQEAATGLDRFARNLNQVEQSTDKQLQATTGSIGALKELGFNVDALHDHMPPLNDVLLMVADRFQKMPDGTEKTAIAMQLFGRAAGPDLIQFLDQGSAGIKDAEETAAKYGLTLSTENVEQVHAFGLAHKDLDAAIQGVTVQVGLMLMPALTAASEAVRDGARAFNENILPAVKAFAEEAAGPVHDALDTIGAAFQSVIQVMAPVIAAIQQFAEQETTMWDGLAAAAKQALGGDLVGALGTAGAALVNFSRDLLEDLAQWDAQFYMWVAEAIPPMMEALGQLMSQLGEWITGTALPYIQQHAREWANAFVEWATEVYGPLLSELSSLLTQLGQWIVSTALPAIGASLRQWEQAFVTWVAPAIGDLLAQLGDLESQVQDWIGETALPAIVDALGQWGQAFIDWLGPNIGPMLTEAATLLAQLTGWIIGTALPDIAEKLLQWGIQFVQWVVDVTPKVLAELANLGGQLLGWIADQLPGFAAQLALWAGEFTRWVVDAANALPSELANFLQQIVQWVTGDGVNEMQSAGTSLGNTLIDGFKNALSLGIPDLLSNLGNLGQRIIDSIRGAFDAGYNGTQYTPPGATPESTAPPVGIPFGPAPVPGANANMGVPAPGDVQGWAQWFINSGLIPDNLVNDPTFLQTLLVGGKAESGLNANRIQGGYQLGSGAGGRGLFQFDMGGMGAPYQGNEQALLGASGALLQAQTIIPDYVRNYQANQSAGLTGQQLILQTIGQSERPLGYDPRTNTLVPGTLGYNNYQSVLNAMGGAWQMPNLPNSQATTDASNQATDAAKKQTDATNALGDAYLGASSSASTTKKTLEEELQPTMEQYNKLLRDSQDQLDKINQTETQNLAANTAKYGPGGTADQAVNAQADQQIGQLESNFSIQQATQSRQAELQAQIQAETAAHQYADQIANTQFQRQQNAADLQRSRAEEDANNAAQAQINAADLTHNRQVEDADNTYKHQQDLNRAQIALQEQLAQATTEQARQSAQKSYDARVQSINDAYTFQQQDLAHQRADQDAEIKYQADEQAKALATKRKQQDEDLAYQQKQQDAATQHAHDMQVADTAFQKQEAQKQTDLQNALAKEALDRQIASINAARDAKIKQDADDLARNQLLIQAKAEQDRQALIKQTQQRESDLEQQAKDRAAAIKATSDQLQPFLDKMEAGLNAFIDKINGTSTNAEQTVADTTSDIATQVSALMGDGGTVPAAIDVSDTAVEVFADQFKLSWDDARQVLSAIESGVTDTMGDVVPHQIQVTDQAVEEFADKWQISWDEARAILESGNNAAKQALGKDIPDAAKATSDAVKTTGGDIKDSLIPQLLDLETKVPDVTKPVNDLIDALNGIPKDVSTTITTNFVTNGGPGGGGGGGGGSGSHNLNSNAGTPGNFTLPNIVTGGSITVQANNLGDAINKAASQTGVTPSQQAGGGTFGGNTNPGLSFDLGGLVPGPVGAPVFATVHGGEYVLPPDVVRRITSGRGGQVSLDDGTIRAIAVAFAAEVAQMNLSVSVDDVHNSLLRKQRRNGTLGWAI